uniref:Maelstrom domain-containing protein n=1 Tax=Anopheles culicifacies TaxID=139723 RepID=A0A182LT72_9DIPT
MDSRRREPYIQQAKQEGSKQNQSRCARSSEIDDKQEIKHETMDKIELIRDSVKERLWQAELADGLDKQVFYLISMTYFCQTSNGYVPAELGVVEFNLECGVKEHLHILIKPEIIPLGFALDAQLHAEKTHGLPLPPNALGVGDYDEIATKLLAFLKVEQSFPPLFTDAKDISMVESILGDILGKQIAGKRLGVSSVAELFFQLKQGAEYHMMSATLFPSVEAAQAIIDENEFSYVQNISCEYHESCGKIMECALSKCIQWAYIISSNCCMEVNVDLIPGKHIPADWEPITTNSVQDASIELNDVMDNGEPDVSQNRERLEDRYADCEPGCSGIRQPAKQARYVSQDPKPDLDELLKQQASGEAYIKRVDLHEPQFLEEDEHRRGMVIRLKESQLSILNVLGPGRGRGIPVDELPPPAVMGRGHGSIHRRGPYFNPRRGR